MSEPIPAAELAAFREVVNAATPGPWEIDYNETVGHIKSLADPERHTPTVARYDIWFDGRVSDNFAESMGYTKDREKANGVFIAQSREMCGRLLDYVDWLRARNEDHTEWLRGRNQNMVALKRVILGELKAECVSRDSFEREIAEISEDIAKSLGEYIAALRYERDAVRAEVDRLRSELNSATEALQEWAPLHHDESMPLAERIAAEGKDFGMVIDHLSRTYYHFTNGQVSKPNTLPEVVFALAEDIARKEAEETVKELLQDSTDDVNELRAEVDRLKAALAAKGGE